MGGTQGCRPRTEGLSNPGPPHPWPLFCGSHSLASRPLPMPRYFRFALRRRRLGNHGCGVEGRGPWESSPFSLYPYFSAPSEVTALQKQNQTNSSITLQWEAPADPQPQFYVYWVHWASRGHPQRKRGPQGHQDNQTGSTNRTHYMVEALAPGTWYCFNVWAESYGVHGYKQSLNASTGEMGLPLTWWGVRSGLGAVRGERTPNPIRPWGHDVMCCSDMDGQRAHGSCSLWRPMACPRVDNRE